ncbi:hypothetical protein FHS83_001277 [Rhizomicrobium palustre]|uniref:PAS domain-containing protein n=1 Tax=Rhizomicrobium palustre TaxID=189966 RepID=A0A846MXJ1_9PROT|nr:PAS domain-containing protein [Rhizomicrobium palustre]NIK87959.1 hypothetical protein [Rhizomicrobium palustre]
MHIRDATEDLIQDTYRRIEFDELRFAEVRQGYAYWLGLCGARLYPAREEISPRPIRHLLAHVILLKVIAGGKDFEYTIVGDDVVRAYKAPLAQRRLSDIATDLPNSARYWSCVYRDIVETGQPWAVRYSAQLEREACFADAEAVLLPLGSSPGCVDHLITFAKRVRCSP